MASENNSKIGFVLCALGSFAPFEVYGLSLLPPLQHLADLHKGFLLDAIFFFPFLWLPIHLIFWIFEITQKKLRSLHVLVKTCPFILGWTALCFLMIDILCLCFGPHNATEGYGTGVFFILSIIGIWLTATLLPFFVAFFKKNSAIMEASAIFICTLFLLLRRL